MIVRKIGKIEQGLATPMPEEDEDPVVISSRLARAYYKKKERVKGFSYTSVYGKNISEKEANLLYEIDFSNYANLAWEIIDGLAESLLSAMEKVIKEFRVTYLQQNISNKALDDIAQWLALWIPFSYVITMYNPQERIRVHKTPDIPKLSEGIVWEKANAEKAASIETERSSDAKLTALTYAKVQDKQQLIGAILNVHLIFGVLKREDESFWEQLAIDLTLPIEERRVKLGWLIARAIRQLNEAKKEFSEYVTNPMNKDWRNLEMIVNEGLILLPGAGIVVIEDSSGQDVIKETEPAMKDIIAEIKSLRVKRGGRDFLEIATFTVALISIFFMGAGVGGLAAVIVSSIDASVGLAAFIAGIKHKTDTERLNLFAEIDEKYRVGPISDFNIVMEGLFVILAIWGLKSGLSGLEKQLGKPVSKIPKKAEALKRRTRVKPEVLGDTRATGDKIGDAGIKKQTYSPEGTNPRKDAGIDERKLSIPRDKIHIEESKALEKLKEERNVLQKQYDEAYAEHTKLWREKVQYTKETDPLRETHRKLKAKSQKLKKRLDDLDRRIKQHPANIKELETKAIDPRERGKYKELEKARKLAKELGRKWEKLPEGHKCIDFVDRLPDTSGKRHVLKQYKTYKSKKMDKWYDEPSKVGDRSTEARDLQIERDIWDDHISKVIRKNDSDTWRRMADSWNTGYLKADFGFEMPLSWRDNRIAFELEIEILGKKPRNWDDIIYPKLKERFAKEAAKDADLNITFTD